MEKLLRNGFNTDIIKADNKKLLVSFAHFRETCIGSNDPLKASFSFLLIGGLK